MEVNVELLGNIEDHCLACLRKDDSMEDVTESGVLIITFKSTFNLEIQIEDGTPKYLCNDCGKKLCDAQQFLSQVQSCLQYFKEHKSFQRNIFSETEVKGEEHIQLEFKDDDNEYTPHPISDTDSDSDNEPLSKLAKKKTRKKIPFNAKLRKFPLKAIERAMDEYRNKFKENSDCILCDFKGISIRNLSCHMIFKHKEEKGTWCSRCNMLYNDLTDHRKTHTNKIWCKFCHKNISRCHYMEHLKGHAGFIYPCEHCQKKFISQKALGEHTVQHKHNKPFQCHLCQKSFKLLKSLEAHLSLHGRYTCEECEKNFEIPELLSSHLCTGRPRKETLNLKEEPVKSREEDDNVFEESLTSRLQEKMEDDMDDRDVNMDNVDPQQESEDLKPKIEIKEVESLTCHFCQRNYKTAYKLQKHIEGHMGIFLVKCRYCDKGFSSNSDLANHERVHTKEKPFICNVCGKGFVSGATLRIHMKQHTGKPEECDLCHKRFCRKSELKLHLQKHRGERPFLCTDCGKSFAQKSHLTCHLTMHSEERPYSCKTCDKSFKKKELLKHHMKLHGGEKKFKCTVCFYECHKNYRLQQHMKMHEGKPDLKVNLCQLCGKGFSSMPLLNSHMSNVHNVIV